MGRATSPSFRTAIKTTRTVWQRWEAISLADKLTLLVIGAAIGQVFVALLQKESAERWAVKQAEASDKAAADQARVASEAASAAASQTARLILATQQIAAASKDANEENKKAVAKSLEQSRRSLEASITAARQDQRAWVQTTEYVLDKEPSGGDKITVSARMTNTGKTPAKSVTTRAHLSVSPQPVLPKWGTPKANTVMFPGSVPVVPYEYTPPPLPVQFYKSGQNKLYIQTLTCFQDVFGATHWVKDCAYHEFGKPTVVFAYCDGGNEEGTDGPGSAKQCQ